MRKTIVRTGAALGTLLLAGYLANRFLGWSPRGLMNATTNAARRLRGPQLKEVSEPESSRVI